MIARQLLGLWLMSLAGGSPAADVSEVRIASVGSETEITVVANGDVQVRDFLLNDPVRLILDVEGASHALPRHTFEGIARGGVVRMRSSQFRDGVVRLVFDLSHAPDYQVENGANSVTVRFRNPAEGFAGWSTGDSGVPAVAGRDAGGEDARSAAASAGSEARERMRERMGDVRGQSGGVERRSEQPRISVTYDSAPMLDVLAGFAEFSGTSIVPGQDVADRVVRGVDIRDKPWDVALDAILASQGLGWKRAEEDIIIVDDLASLRDRDELQTETRVLRINYAQAEQVAETLERMATPDRGQVVSYGGTNSLIVTDAPSVVARMDSLVRVLDRRTPQVSIEAKIVFVDRTDVEALGLSYELKDRAGGTAINRLVDGEDPRAPGEFTDEPRVRLDGESIAAVANATQRIMDPSLQILASAAFGGFSLFAFLDALEAHALSDVQAAPTVRVVDNHSARIQVGERTPIRVLEPQAQLQQAQVNVQFEETGIILEVTPHITNDNQILLDLTAERSAVGPPPPGVGDLGFLFEKQVGETRLLLDDGETAVIGGLTLSEMEREVRGIPGVMNLPLLGGLFRTTREQERKQDLIILVTPHIVPVPEAREAGPAVPLSPGS